MGGCGGRRSEGSGWWSEGLIRVRKGEMIQLGRWDGIRSF